MARIPALILAGSENHSEPSSEIWEKVERILVSVRDKFPSLRKLHLGLSPYIDSRTGIIGSEDTAYNMEKASSLIDDILSGRDEIEIEVSVGEGLLECNLMVRADNEADALYSRVDGDERLWRKGSQRQGFWIAGRYKKLPADELEESDDDGTRMCGYWISIS